MGHLLDIAKRNLKALPSSPQCCCVYVCSNTRETTPSRIAYNELNELNEQRVDAPEPIPPDWVAIPLEQCIFDPLYRGTLTGKVPDGWSREGWMMSLRDRMTRTDDKAVRERLQAEIRGVVGEAEADPAPGRGVTGGDR
jgi:hypothetical protein